MTQKFPTIRFCFLILCLSFFSLSILGQNNFHYYFDVEVIEGEKLAMPWIGGLNGVQYSQIDLNNDQQLDIIAFDRSTQIKHCFLKKENTYEYAPEYNHIFPDDIKNFLQLIDFNNDGKKDLFTAGNLGLLVYENRSTNGQFKWEKVSDYLTYQSLGGNEVNLQLTFNDYPNIHDIDQDGDLDIFSFQTSGLESSIVFYKNLSIENSGSPGMNPLIEEDDRWGDLEECLCNEFVFGAEECFSNAAQRQAFHAGGKSVFISDLNMDNILELVTSHQECRNTFSFNGAQAGIDPVYDNFTTSFPNAAEPASLSYYPNTMALTDESGRINSLMISPNLETQLSIPADYRSSNWQYQVSADGSKSLVTKSFLQEDMIDWGMQSSPAVFDFDSDEDLDLFVAYTHTNEEGTLFSAIAQYENSGSNSTPSFELINNNYLNFQQSVYTNLLIQFIDLDQDGIVDLTFQATEAGQNSLFVKLGQPDGSFNAEVEISGAFIGFGYSFHFADILGSSAPDLMIGKSSGGLILYENLSSSGSAFNFSQRDNNYLGIGDDFFRSSLKLTTGDIDNDGQSDLICTDQSGILRVYTNYRSNTEQYDSISIYNKRSFGFESSSTGSGNTIILASLFANSYPSIILGSISGGLKLLRNDNEYELAGKEEGSFLRVFPNPNNQSFVNLAISNDATVRVLNIKGEVVIAEQNFSAGASQLDISRLIQGLYFIQASLSNGKHKSTKLLVY